MISYFVYFAFGLASVMFSTYLLSKKSCISVKNDLNLNNMNVDQKLEYMAAALSEAKDAIICWSAASSSMVFGFSIIVLVTFAYWQSCAARHKL